ncbi:uncharacterized protein UV8b_08019 [Ustilaginoidea virens]|uniref:Uncharacterized protein n=1 Tax=Ustilaginoidea virens TaxID=1159556 RepID=A0A8E5MKK8_USTVR|nr:uncharacterized protein UV8b_08019 [Ustilaginoidea virens]QUC23778.1 hypothetical protein UV8b_08019 [Ustilaginoidea virens]
MASKDRPAWQPTRRFPRSLVPDTRALVTAPTFAALVLARMQPNQSTSKSSHHLPVWRFSRFRKSSVQANA